jgi:hypothetical protein
MADDGKRADDAERAGCEKRPGITRRLRWLLLAAGALGITPAAQSRPHVLQERNELEARVDAVRKSMHSTIPETERARERIAQWYNWSNVGGKRPNWFNQ